MTPASIVFILAGVLIGAVFLRAAVALYNRMARSPEAPSPGPEPGFGKAIGITFITFVGTAGVGLLIRLATGPLPGEAGPGGRGFDPLALLVSVLVSLLLMAALLTALLPTRFGRALMVTLCYLAINAVVGGIILAVVVGVFGVALW